MSSILDVGKFECVVVPVCPLFIEGFFLTNYFILIDYWPTIVSIAIYAVSCYHYELYFLLFGFCLTFDWAFNTGLQYAFAQPPRFPGCGNTYEFPSFSAQHIVLFITLVLCFFSWWDASISPFRLFLLQLFGTIVLLARIYLGINTASQLIVGGLFGLAEGIVLNYVLYYILENYSSRIETWKIYVLAGLRNTIGRKNRDRRTFYKILLDTRLQFGKVSGKKYMEILEQRLSSSKIHIQ